MPTNFVASKLNIDPKMPFRGSSALHAARKTRKAALKVSSSAPTLHPPAPSCAQWLAREVLLP